MFRGKESSNRIELSRLVQDLLNFGVLGSLWLWGGGRSVGGHQGHEGCPHTHTCMHMHAHTCTHAHLYMYRNCKWPPTWRHSMFSMFNMHVHACVHGTPPTHPYPPPPHLPICHPQGGGSLESLKI